MTTDNTATSVVSLDEIIDLNQNHKTWLVIAPDGRMWGGLRLSDFHRLIALEEEAQHNVSEAHKALLAMPVQGNG